MSAGGYCVGTWNVLPWRDAPLFEPCDYGGAPSWQAFKPVVPTRVLRVAGSPEEFVSVDIERVVLRPMTIRVRKEVWVPGKVLGWGGWRFAVVYCTDADRVRVRVAVELYALAMRLVEFIYARVPCCSWP